MKNGARQPTAALAIEWKRILQCRRQLILKRSLQSRPPSVEPRLDGFRFDRKHVCRFLGAQTLDVPQYEDLAK